MHNIAHVNGKFTEIRDQIRSPWLGDIVDAGTTTLCRNRQYIYRERRLYYSTTTRPAYHTLSQPAGSHTSNQPGGPPCWASSLAFGLIDNITPRCRQLFLYVPVFLSSADGLVGWQPAVGHWLLCQLCGSTRGPGKRTPVHLESPELEIEVLINKYIPIVPWAWIPYLPVCFCLPVEMFLKHKLYLSHIRIRSN